MNESEVLVIDSHVSYDDYKSVAKPMRGRWWNFVFSFYWCRLATKFVSYFVPLIDTLDWVVLLVSVALAIVVGAAIVHYKIRRQFSGDEPILWRTSMDREGVSTTVNGATTFVPWKSIRSIEDDSKAFILDRSLAPCIYVFKNGIASPWTSKSVLQALQKLNQGTYPPASGDKTSIAAEIVSPTSRSGSQPVMNVWPPPIEQDAMHSRALANPVTIGFLRFNDNGQLMSVNRFGAQSSYIFPMMASTYLPSPGINHRNVGSDSFFNWTAVIFCLFSIVYLIDGLWFTRLDIDRASGKIRRNGWSYASTSEVAAVSATKVMGSWNVVLDMRNGRRKRLFHVGALVYQSEANRCAQIIDNILWP